MSLAGSDVETGIDSNFNKAFKWSLGIHGGLLILLFLALLVGWIRNRQESYVFTLVATTPQLSNDLQGESVTPPFEKESWPEIDSLPEVKSLAEPKPQSISYQEYVKKFGQPKADTKGEKPRSRKVEVGNIDVRQMTQDLRNRTLRTDERVQVGNAVNANAIDRYKAALYNRILKSWRKPRGYQGDNLRVIVFLAVSQDGTIRFLGFRESSGNDVFDQSVKDAIIRAGNGGRPPPGGLPETLWMVFRLADS